jgi:hypothetical protein
MGGGFTVIKEYVAKTYEEAVELEQKIVDETMRYTKERNTDDLEVLRDKSEPRTFLAQFEITRTMSPVGQELYTLIYPSDYERSSFIVALLFDSWANPETPERKVYEEINSVP